MTDMPTSTVYLRPPVWALLVAVLLGGSFYVYGKNLELRAPNYVPTTISVSGDGKVSTAPDIAWLTFGIATGRQPSAKAAIAVVKTNMDKILAAVKAAGVESKDITTQSFWLNPAYDYPNGVQTIRGYEASQSLSVKVRDLDKVGDVLSAATNAGANQAGGITFSIDEPDTVQAQARAEAIQKAQAKAKVLAASLGMSLGRLTGFSEGGSVGPPMPMMQEYAVGSADMAKQSLAIPAGEQDVTSTVVLTYELN